MSGMIPAMMKIGVYETRSTILPVRSVNAIPPRPPPVPASPVAEPTASCRMTSIGSVRIFVAQDE